MDSRSPLFHAKHILRAFIALLVLVVALLLGRSFFVPDTFGQYGHYRGASVAEFRALPVRHGGDTSCQECHADQFATHAAGGHHSVHCESCHAPLAVHVAGGARVADMPIRRSADLCLGCHRRLEARPATFPQIQPREHLQEQDAEFTPDVCFDCHDPHAPL